MRINESCFSSTATTGQQCSALLALPVQWSVEAVNSVPWTPGERQPNGRNNQAKPSLLLPKSGHSGLVALDPLVEFLEGMHGCSGHPSTIWFPLFVVLLFLWPVCWAGTICRDVEGLHPPHTFWSKHVCAKGSSPIGPYLP